MVTASQQLDMEFVALTVLEAAERPVGSATLAAALGEAGIGVAEATAGRFLRTLDERGLTMTPGVKQGRVLTAEGRRRLEEIASMRRAEEHGARLVRVAQDAELGELIDVLLVRRVIEAEGARFAAGSATDGELADILAQAREGRSMIAAGGVPDAASSARFHRSVASASGNRMLASVAHLLIEPANPNLTKVLEEVSMGADAVGAQSEEHIALAEALVARDADLAWRLAYDHGTHLVEAARTYLERTSAPSVPAR